MNEPRHALVDDEVVDLRRRIAELEAAAEITEHPLLRRFIPRWAFIAILVITLPLALYYGIQFGLSGEKYLFPTASVACH